MKEITNIEEETLEHIKFVLISGNEAQAIRLIEDYGFHREEQLRAKYAKRKYTIKDIKKAWKAADNYREQLERIYSGYSNFTETTYPNKHDYLASLESDS